MFCKNCGAEIDEKAEICPKCGVRVKPVPISTEKKSSGIAAIASFFILIFIGIGLILLPLFWVYNIYDAYKTAERINASQSE